MSASGAAPAMEPPDDGGVPWLRFICNACGWIYDEAKGDPDSGLPPGTRFADIPDDWSCPLCAVTKADFSPLTPAKAKPHPTTARGAGANQPARGKGGQAGTVPGVVIVGGGRAGWQMAEALRALDGVVPITLVSACSADVYDKPLLSVAMARHLPLDGLVRETGTQAAARLGVKLLAHTQATRICTRTHTLHTTRATVPFGHLVLAHGAQVALPPALPAEQCWRINHLDAYLRFRAALGDATRHVAIVGAGLIGCELANDLALGGHRVTLLDSASEPLARWSAQQAGSTLLGAWAGLPIRFVGEVRIVGMDAAHGVGHTVHTECGQAIHADAVVAATGLATPSRLAHSAGLAWNQGIAVDTATLATSQPRISALGDCITVDGQASRYIEPIARQARTIASRVLHPDDPTQWVPWAQQTALVRVKTTSCPLNLTP